MGLIPSNDLLCRQTHLLASHPASEKKLKKMENNFLRCRLTVGGKRLKGSKGACQDLKETGRKTASAKQFLTMQLLLRLYCRI